MNKANLKTENCELKTSPVHHDQTARRFSITTDGLESIADYRIESDRLIFTHTYVPPELRGQGLAADLIKAGLEFAKAENKKIIPQCSYVETYLRRHPEYANLRA